MKSQYILIFIAFFLTIFVSYTYQVDMTTSYEQQTTLYQEKLRETVAATAKEAAKNTYIEDDINYYFKLDSQRKKAIDTFYRMLENTFNTLENSNSSFELKEKVPVIALIDTDGFYIYYREAVTLSDGLDLIETVTPIFTWSETTRERNYLIRYFVKEDDLVEVTDLGNKKSIKGTHDEVYEYFERDTELKEFLELESDFQSHRIATIVSKTQEIIEYYINNYNYSVTGISSEYDWGIKYTFEMPQIDNEDWCGLLDEPGVISFLQKKPFISSDDYINIFAMKGVEIVEKQTYLINVIDGQKFYHKKNCTAADADEDLFYNYKSDCAKVGAYPCEICKP